MGWGSFRGPDRWRGGYPPTDGDEGLYSERWSRIKRLILLRLRQGLTPIQLLGIYPKKPIKPTTMLH